MPSPSSDSSSFGASYDSRLTGNVRAVEAEDSAPPAGPHETDVWLTEWQVAEDGFDVALDENVDWALVPMDQDWAARLFAGRRTVDLQRDSYAEPLQDASETAGWTRLCGRVTRIDQISVRYQQSNGPADPGPVPVIGGASQHSVHNLHTERAHHGALVGWIVRVRG